MISNTSHAERSATFEIRFQSLFIGAAGWHSPAMPAAR
jgi:hypothetical protein